MSVAIAPTSPTLGDVLNLTYTGWVPGTAVWVCYSSGTSAILSSPSCADPGNATTVAEAIAGAMGSVCTANASDGAAVPLTWSETTQRHIRARACTTATDVTQVANTEMLGIAETRL